MLPLGLLLLLQDPSATVTGTVRLGHRAPPPRIIEVSYEPLAGVLYPKGLESDELLVGRDDALAAALVYVKGAVPVPAPTPAPFQAAIQGFRLVPRVFTLRAGQELVVTNRDRARHVYYVRPYANKEKNVELPTTGDTFRHQLSMAETGITAECDLHPWEQSWMHVFDHPFYSLTGADGRFSIGGLAPGRYTLVVRHERCKPREIEIEVKAGESKRLDFALETHEGPPPFPWLNVGVGGGAVLFLTLAGLVLLGRRPRPRPAV